MSCRAKHAELSAQLSNIMSLVDRPLTPREDDGLCYKTQSETTSGGVKASPQYPKAATSTNRRRSSTCASTTQALNDGKAGTFCCRHAVVSVELSHFTSTTMTNGLAEQLVLVLCCVVPCCAVLCCAEFCTHCANAVLDAVALSRQRHGK
jgi:hypothetical protein